MILIKEGKIFVEGKETNDPALIGLALLDFVEEFHNENNSPNEYEIVLIQSNYLSEKITVIKADQDKKTVYFETIKTEIPKEPLVTPAESSAVVNEICLELERNGLTTTKEQKQNAIRQINNLKK